MISWGIIHTCSVPHSTWQEDICIVAWCSCVLSGGGRPCMLSLNGSSMWPAGKVPLLNGLTGKKKRIFRRTQMAEGNRICPKLYNQSRFNKLDMKNNTISISYFKQLMLVGRVK